MRQRPTRQHLAALFTLIVACTLPIPAAAFQGPGELPDFARDAWEATVFVETLSWHRGIGDRDVATGSGVVIAHEPEDGTVLIATSAHVVPCDTACLVRVHFPASGHDRSTAVRARRLWHDARQDLALLQAPWPPGKTVHVARLANDSGAAGGRVLAIGFPDPSLRSSDGSARHAKLFSDGLLIDARNGFQADYRAYSSTAVGGHLEPDSALLHTAEILPGSSGGPLIDSSGAVLGINTGSLVPARGDGCVRADSAGARCLHLAVALGAVLEHLESPPLLSAASTN